MRRKAAASKIGKRESEGQNTNSRSSQWAGKGKLGEGTWERIGRTSLGVDSREYEVDIGGWKEKG